MVHHYIKQKLLSAISDVVSDIASFSLNPGKNFTRTKKLPPDKLIRFLISEGSSSTKNELFDFFGMDTLSPSSSAFSQQRAKLKPEAVEAVFRNFNKSLSELAPLNTYRFLAADGSDLTFLGNEAFASPDFFVSEGHSMKGFASMHLNALYDLDTHTYEDALIQPVHSKDEFGAFCSMVDRYQARPEEKTVFIGDRGYPSYNTMAHVIHAGHFFLFRVKDITGKGMTKGLGLPQCDFFDEKVCISIVRSNSNKVGDTPGIKRFIGKDISFDFVEYGSLDSYTISFRVVRFPLSDNSYECLVTNLPVEDFPLEEIKRLYFRRWGLESAFRKLKYTIGMNNFHAKKTEHIKQEVWARLIAYNLTETMIRLSLPSAEESEKKGTKHEYQMNFSTAAHICRVFLHLPVEKDKINVTELIRKEILPIRPDRQSKRLQTAHFRKPKYFVYRAS